MRFRESETGLNPDVVFLVVAFQGGSSVAVFFVCTSVVSYVAFALSSFIPHLSFFCCLGRAVLRDCGISWVPSHLFLDTLQLYKNVMALSSVEGV